MILVIWPLLIAIIGVLLFALASNGKVAEIGKWLFILGAMWTIYALSGKTIKIG